MMKQESNIRATSVASTSPHAAGDLVEYLAEAASGDGVVSKRNETEPIERLANNDSTPDYAVMEKERPRHRMIVELAATGRYTNKEIAEALECSPVTVNYALRQPWSRDLLVKLMRKSGDSEREKTFALLEGLTIKAVERQEEILRLELSKETMEPIRKVTNDILNRAYGTPTATLKVSKSDDLSRLSDAELAEMLAEQRSRS